jgi:ABC transporter substrate binding protein
MDHRNAIRPRRPLRSPARVAEFMSSPPDVIATAGTPVLAALKQATRSIPIVFSVVNDPVGQGFVANLARPGGNITGFSFVDFPMIGKWLEIMKHPRREADDAHVQSGDRAVLPGIPRSGGFRLAGAQRSGDRNGHNSIRARARGAA